MAQTEQLNIKVTQDGASNVAKLLKAIAAEARAAKSMVDELRRTVGGKGTVAEAKKSVRGGTQSDAAKAHASAVKKSQAEIRKAMIATANTHSTLHKQSVDRMKEMNRRVNARMATQDEISRKMKIHANEKQTALNREAAAERSAAAATQKAMNTTWARRKKIFMDRRRMILAAKKDAASALAADRKTFQTTTQKFVAGNLKREAAAHKAAEMAARRHTNSLRGLRIQSGKTATGIRALSDQVYFAQRSFATLGGALIVRAYLTMSDQFQNLSNRIRLVTNSTEEFNDTQNRLFKIAKDTRQSVVSTTETFIRLRKATESQHVPVERLYTAMETINKMLALSGRGAVEAEQAMRQLSQAFSKGKLDGDEFRTVSEAMPSVLTALEKSLGKTRGELRQMSEQGLISTEALLTAFEGVKNQVDRDFATSVVTLSQSFQLLKDEVFKAIAAFNEESGALTIIQGLMGFLADHIAEVVIALKLLFYWMAAKAMRATIMWATSIRAKLVPALIQGIINTNLLSKAIGLQSTLALGGAAAFATMAVAVSAAAVAGYKFGQVMDGWFGISDAISDPLAETFSSFESGPDTALGFIKKYKSEIASLREEEKRNRAQGVGGPGGSTDREIQKLQQKIDLHESYIQRIKEAKEAAAQKIIDEQNFNEALKAWDTLNNVTTDVTKAMAKHKNAVGIVGVAHKYGAITAEEMATALALLDEELKAVTITLRESQVLDVNEAFKTLQIGKRALAAAKAKGKTDKEANKAGRAAVQWQEDFVKARKELHKEDVTRSDHVLDFQAKEMANNSRSLRQLKEQMAFKDPPEKKKGKKPEDFSGQALKDLIAMRAALNPVTAATEAYTEATDTLAAAQAFNHIEGKEAMALRAQFKASIQDQLTPMAAFTKLIDQQAAVFGMSTEQASAYNEALALQKGLLDQLDKDGKGKEEEVADLVARLQAQTALTQASAKYADSILAEMDAIVSRNDELDKYEITRQAIDRKSGLDEAQRHELHLKNLMKLYPEVSQELRDLDSGTLNMTQHQRDLITLEQLEIKKLLQLNQLRANGTITMKQYEDATRRVTEETRLQTQEINAQMGMFAGIKRQLTDTAIYEQQVAAITNIYSALEESVIGTVQNLTDVVDNILSGAEDPWKDFASNMHETMRTMVDSILAELTRLMIKMALAAAFKQSLEGGSGVGSLGGVSGAGEGLAGSGGTAGFLSASGLNPSLLDGIGGFRHGGTVPKFANGGSMQVGGSGGPDTKLVQFMASPGENVQVTSPGQSRLDNRPEPQPAPQVNINNIVDPSQMASAMSSPSGRKAILNVIQQDGGAIRRLLG